MAPRTVSNLRTPHGLSVEERQRWEVLSQLDYKKAKVPETRTLDVLGIRGCFEEFCQEAQLLNLFQDADSVAYHRLTLEFLATLVVQYDDSELLGMRFRCRNRAYEMSLAQFNALYGFTGTVTQEPPQFKTNIKRFWSEITGGRRNFLANGAKTAQIRNPVLRFVQKACASYPFARAELGSVQREEVFLLWNTLHKLPPLNLGYYMIKHLERTARKDKGTICVGKVVGAIIAHFNVRVDDIAADDGGNWMDMAFVRQSKMIAYDGNQILLTHRDGDHFPLPNTVLTYVNGPENKANWGMKTHAHRLLARGGMIQQDEDDEQEEEEEPEQQALYMEEAQEQPESSRREKRSRPQGASSSRDQMQQLIEDVEELKLSFEVFEGQAMQRWTQDDERRRVEDERWAQAEEWRRIEEERWRQQQEYMAHMYSLYPRPPPPPFN